MSSRSKDGTVSPDPLDTRDIIFTSLLLLGFDPRGMEETYRIPFTRDMFSLPNKKGFEVVVHFLFEKLNPAVAQERFRNCWPIFDKKREQNFRKTISNWLTEISKEDPDAKFPRIVPSSFMSPGGDKFYMLLLYFCNYVILKTCRQSHGVKSRELLLPVTVTADNKPLLSVMARTIKASGVNPRKRFLRETQEAIDLIGEWKRFASGLVKEHRSLSKKIRNLEHRIREEEVKMIAYTKSAGDTPTIKLRSSGMTDGEWDVLAVRRAQKVQKVRDLWKSVDDCNGAQVNERAVVRSILSEEARKVGLDAGDIPVQVPELLLRECEEEIQRRQINNVYVGGKLDLVSLVKLWNLSLRLYLEKLNEAPLPDFEDMMPSVVTHVHTQNAHLAKARALRHSLSDELLPDLEKSVLELSRYMREGIEIPTRDPLVTASPRHFLGSGVGLIPPTPPVSFDPAATPTVNTAPALFRKSPTDVSTPEAMTQISETVHRMALRKALPQGTPVSTLKEARVPTPQQSTQKHQRVSRLRKPNRSRYRSDASSERHSLKETPVSARRTGPEGSRSRLPANGRGVQTTGKKKKRPPAFQRPSEIVEKEHHAKVNDLPSHRHNGATAKAQVTVPGREPSSAARDRAHNRLIDQIVDAVVMGDSPERSITPTLTPEVPASEDVSPAILALKDPIASLDLDAFASRDKLRHSPVAGAGGVADGSPSDQDLPDGGCCHGSSEEDCGTLPSQQAESESRSTPEGMKVAQLIDLDDVCGQSDHKSGNLARAHIPGPDASAALGHLQYSSPAVRVSSPTLLMEGRDSPPDGNTFPTRGPGGTLPFSDDLNTAALSSQTDAIVSQDLLELVEPEVQSSRHDSQQDISLWHLDEELPEVFQTRTPELPGRLRMRSTGTGRDISPQSLMNGSMGTERVEESASASPPSPQVEAYPEARRLNMTSSVEDEDSVANVLESDHRSDKRRFRSGGSHKSVTFSDPLYKEARGVNGRLESPEWSDFIFSEETMPEIDEEDLGSTPGNLGTSPRAGPIFDGGDPLQARGVPPQGRETPPQGRRNPPQGRGGQGLLSEEYLASSPRILDENSGRRDVFSTESESPDQEGRETSFSETTSETPVGILSGGFDALASQDELGHFPVAGAFAHPPSDQTSPDEEGFVRPLGSLATPRQAKSGARSTPEGRRAALLINLDHSHRQTDVKSTNQTLLGSPDPEESSHLRHDSQQDISLWHLDEEFPGLFATKTPELPGRLRMKSTEGNEKAVHHSLPNGRLSIEGEESIPRTVPSPHPHVARLAAKRLDMTPSAPDDDDISESPHGDNGGKTRFRSGGFQKSVTFSEPLAERREDVDRQELLERTHSIAEETMPDFIEEEDVGFSPTADVQASSGAETSSQRILQISVDSVDALSNGEITYGEIMTKPIEDILIHISPTVTPSKAPQVSKGEGRAADRGTSEPGIGYNRSGKHTDTPTGPPPSQESSLSQRMASLRLATGSLGVNGTQQNHVKKALKIPADFT